MMLRAPQAVLALVALLVVLAAAGCQDGSTRGSQRDGAPSAPDLSGLAWRDGAAGRVDAGAGPRDAASQGRGDAAGDAARPSPPPVPVTADAGPESMAYQWNVFSVGRGCMTPLGPYDFTYDNISVAWQRYHLMSDGETLLIRGPGEGHNSYGDNSVRWTKPALGQWGRFLNYGVAGNRIITYNNHYRVLIPGEALGDGLGDALLWPTQGVWRQGPNRWTHGHLVNRSRGQLPSTWAITAVTHERDPVVTTSAYHAIALGERPALLPHGYFHAPGWSLHDRIYRVVSIADTPTDHRFRIVGADTTGDPTFTAGAVRGEPTGAWYEGDPNNFWNGPLWDEFVRDDTRGGAFGGGGGEPYTLYSIYNPYNDWYHAGRKGLVFGGTAGTQTGYHLRGWILERNPSYPGTQPQPWRFVDWPVVGISEAGFTGATQVMSQGKVVEGIPGHPDAFYLVGMPKDGGPADQRRHAFRIRLSDQIMERLPDLPASVDFTYQALVTFDRKRHLLVWISKQLCVLDVDDVAAGWRDITPAPYDWATRSGTYHPAIFATGAYLEKLDAHYYRQGAMVGYGDPNWVERFAWNRLQLPLGWIKSP